VSESADPSVEPSFCSSCGRDWALGQNYCPGCGYQSVRAGDGDDSEVAAEPASNSTRGVPRRMGGVTWCGGQIILGIIVVIFALFSAAMVASLVASVYPEQEDAVATWISVHLMALGIFATVWYFGLRHARYPLAVLRLSCVQRPRKRTVLMMLGVLATSLTATSIYAGLVDALGWEILIPPSVESDIIFDGPAMLLTFQALAFVTPLSEEIFFRGFIFRGLLPKMNPWMAITVSALVFSVFHLSIGVMIPIFITGFLLAWLYWRTGSLWAAIGAHAGQNALAVGLQALSS
jgi:membrane protease YdiL (CAAX protease family)